MRTAAIKINNGDLNRKILNVMLFVLGTLAVFYMAFLGKMVYNIVERKSLESQARNLATEVGELELSYLSASEKIDLSLSESMGFKEVAPKYATRKSLGSLTRVNNEI